jgi:SAM-dependent methyltransferase
MSRDDVYGRLLHDLLDGKEAFEIVERDDGFVAAYPARYLLAPFREWKPVERRAMRYVRGRVLDAGCGGGRVALHLQQRGLDVVAIDTSPGAVEVCRRRGVLDARLVSLADVDESLAPLDTIVMLGNNLGLVGHPSRARRLLRRLHPLMSERGRIVAETFDPHGSVDAADRRYVERSRRRGRHPGQMRVRVRYRTSTTPWFDYLRVSPADLVELLEGSGWRLERTLGDGPGYVAVIGKA